MSIAKSYRDKWRKTNKPTETGWYWFLPDRNSQASMDLVQTRRPVILEITNSSGILMANCGGRFSHLDSLSGIWSRVNLPRSFAESLALGPN